MLNQISHVKKKWSDLNCITCCDHMILLGSHDSVVITWFCLDHMSLHKIMTNNTETATSWGKKNWMWQKCDVIIRKTQKYDDQKQRFLV